MYSNVPKCRQALTWGKGFRNGLFIGKVNGGILCHKPQFQILLPNSEQLAKDWSKQVASLIYASTIIIALLFFTWTSFPSLKLVILPLLHPSLPFYCSAFISTVG